MPHSLVILLGLLLELTVALALWVAWRAARRRAAGLAQVAARAGELEQVLERSHSELLHLGDRAQQLAALVAPDDQPPPGEPLRCLDQVEQQLRAQLAALSRHRRAEQQLRQDLSAAREDLREATRRLQERRARRPEDGAERGEATLPTSTDLLETLAQQTATRLQLHNAQVELEELRARLRSADRAILGLEDQLREQRLAALEPRSWPEPEDPERLNPLSG